MGTKAEQFQIGTPQKNSKMPEPTHEKSDTDPNTTVNTMLNEIAKITRETAKKVCSICEVEFANQDSLRRHVNDIHKAEREYKCGVDYCPLTFARKDTRDKHEARARKDYKKHGVETECNQCGEIFETTAALEIHNVQEYC